MNERENKIKTLVTSKISFRHVKCLLVVFVKRDLEKLQLSLLHFVIWHNLRLIFNAFLKKE